MADKEASTPAEPPKPVHIGGESILDRLLPHIKKILIGVVVLAVVLSVIFAIMWRKDVARQKTTQKLANVLQVARKPVQPAPPAPTTPDPATPKPAEPATPKPADGYQSNAERATTVLDAMTKQGVDPPGHAYRAGLLLDAGKLDEAIAEYRKGQAAKGVDGVLAREGLGIALETKAVAQKDAAARQKLLEEALAAFVAMQPDDKGPRRAYALYHQGRIQLTLGKRAEAKAAFEKAKELGARTDLESLVAERLSAMGS